MTALCHLRPASLKEFLYGAAYYPEHWPEFVRAGDPALFRAAGFNVVRMGEFAWDILEPSPGCYDFTLFDETVARLAEVGIRTIFCTPTAAPPRWLTRDHPECLRVDEDGRIQRHGSRQHASHFCPVFREFSRRITQALADHFKDNPHVLGWQTDNEFHCHFAEDHGPAAQTAFARFLREKFEGDIGALNRAWGTAFWAQTYDCFEDIPTPIASRPTHPNPAHILDYHRFLSDGVMRFQREQVEILRAANPRWFATHNGCFRSIDYRGPFTGDLDFLSYDSYPFFTAAPAARRVEHAFNLDYVRSYSGNFLLMEQQSGPGGQSDYLQDTPEPGELRRMAYASIAHGADGLLLFRERTCPFGAEQYWIGVLDHDNIPRRRYQEAVGLGSELARIGPALLGSSVMVDIAVSGGDFTAQHAHIAPSLGLPTPRQTAEKVHAYFHRRGHLVGCVHPEDRLDGIKLYFITNYSTFDAAWIPSLKAWIEAGGVLVIGARTASKDLDNNVITEPAPGLLRDLTGITIADKGRQNQPDLRKLEIMAGEVRISTSLWYEQLIPLDEVEVVATWVSRHLKGSAAITRRQHGRGAVYYVGTYFSDELLDALSAHLTACKALPLPESLPDGVEKVVRANATHRFTFLINHGDIAVTVSAPPQGHELIGDLPVGCDLKIDSNGVCIIKTVV